MKTNLSLLLSLFILFSCVAIYGPEDDPEKFGFGFRVTNDTFPI